MDFDATGLLDGLHGEERAARLRLLEALAEDGVSLEELKTAVEEKRLVLVPVERVLEGRYTALEIEDKTGVSAELLLRLRRTTGLPEANREDRVFGDEDVAAARSVKLFLDAGIDERGIARITRVLGASMARLAATTTGSFAETFLKPGDNEDEVAMRFATLAKELTPALTPVLMAAFRAHLLEAVRRGMLDQEALESGQVPGAQDLAVCFADLVGFTRLGGQIDVQRLGSLAERLEELANEVTKPPVRLVKTIGDAAMFVSSEIAPLVHTALSLVQAAHERDLPSVRAGVAFGPAGPNAGDFYGPSVNLASRVTGIARPDSVLCTKDVRDATEEEFEWSFAGRHRLKGIKEQVPMYRARHRNSDASAGASASASESSGN